MAVRFEKCSLLQASAKGSNQRSLKMQVNEQLTAEVGDQIDAELIAESAVMLVLRHGDGAGQL